MPNFLKNLLTLITDASPANRDFNCAYVLLQNKEGDGQVVGTYVQGFYQLAKVGGLRCQIEAKRVQGNPQALKQIYPKLYKQLYKTRQDEKTGETIVIEKSPFELAIINKVAKNDIQNEITDEYTWQNNDPKGLVPQDVSKYRMMPEWLNQLDPKYKPKFRIVGNPQRLTITVDNKVKPEDKGLHAVMQVMGMLVTLTTFIALVMTVLPVAFLASLSTLSLIAVAAAGSLVGLFALKTMGFGNVSNFFGIGEVLWTDVRALLSKQFLKKDKISWGKLARSLGFAIAIAGLALLAASATFSAILALPLIASLGFGANIIAGLFAASTFVVSCIGASMPVRCFVGFGIWDNTIPSEMISKADIKPLSNLKVGRIFNKEQTSSSNGSGPAPFLTSYAPTTAQRKQWKLDDNKAKLREEKEGYRPYSPHFQ